MNGNLTDWGYSRHAAAQIEAVLNDLDYKFSFEDEIGVFKLNFNLKASYIKHLSMFILVEKKLYTVTAICPVRVTKEKMAQAAEYLMRINRRIQIGVFVLDFDTGEIRTRCNIPFRGLMPWTDVVEQSIRIPIELFEKCGNGLLDVLYGQKDPKIAAEEALTPD